MKVAFRQKEMKARLIRGLETLRRRLDLDQDLLDEILRETYIDQTVTVQLAGIGPLFRLYKDLHELIKFRAWKAKRNEPVPLK